MGWRMLAFQPQKEQTLQTMSERTSEIAQHYLDDFELTWSSFKGKKILDAGAGTGDFVFEARARGIDAVGLEILPELYIEWGELTPEIIQTIPFVKGSMTVLPFQDKSFDLVIAHSIGGFMGPKRELKNQVRASMLATREAMRVLRQGGEYLTGPMTDGALRLFKTFHPNPELHIIESTKRDPWVLSYLTLRKE